MASYFYYWVPTQVFINFTIPNIIKTKHHLPAKVISDIGEDFSVSSIIDPSSFNLEITIAKNDIIIETIPMLCKSYHSNGIVIYEVTESLSNKTKEILELQAYHQFKSYLHIHSHHDDNEDSLVHAYVTHNHLAPIDDAIQHYCLLYEKKFVQHHHNLSHHTPKYLSKKYHELHDPRSIIPRISLAKEIIYRAYGEMIYAEFLMSTFSYDQKRTEYTMIFKKHQKEFDILHNKYQQLLENINIDYSRIITNYQNILAIGGLLLGIIGVVISFF